MIIDFPTLIKENNNQPYEAVIHLGETNLGKVYEANQVKKVLWVNSDQIQLRAIYDSMKFSPSCATEMLSEDFGKKPFCQIYREHRARLDLDLYSFIYVESNPLIIQGFEELFTTFPGLKAIYLRDINGNESELDLWLGEFSFEKRFFSTKYNQSTNRNECDIFYLRR